MQNEEKKVKKGFMANTKSELKKVIWPTGKQTVKGTAVTIVFVLLITAILVCLNVCFDYISNVAYDFMLGTNNDKQIVQVISGDKSGEVSGEVSGDVSGDTIASGEINQ